jgi:hypothetical protein
MVCFGGVKKLELPWLLLVCSQALRGFCENSVMSHEAVKIGKLQAV